MTSRLLPTPVTVPLASFASFAPGLSTRLTHALRASLLAACVTGAAFGQGAAPRDTLDRAIIASTAQLTPAQRTALSAYAAKQLQILATSTDAKALEDARAALVSPARDPSATPTFRKSYATVLIAELAPVVKGADLRRAINAMQVLRFARNPESLDVILERVSITNEADAGKRIAASSLVVDAFEDLDANNAYYETAARRLRDAAAVETDWMALQQKLNAIGAAARRKELPADNARTVRRSQVETFGLVAKSVKASKTADVRVMALQRALIGLRNDLLVMPAADRTIIAKSLVPALTDLLAAANTQWTSARTSAEITASYGSMVNSCEVILRLLDRVERPAAYAGTKPDADSRVLATTWDANDATKFGDEVKRWSAIASATPYKN